MIGYSFTFVKLILASTQRIQLHQAHFPQLYHNSDGIMSYASIHRLTGLSVAAPPLLAELLIGCNDSRRRRPAALCNIVDFKLPDSLHLMTPSVAPVLVAGGGPSGLVVALTLLQNHIPVRVIDKEPQYHIGQRGHGLWPRTFEVFHFLRAHEIHQRATPVLPIREYKPGTLEPTKTFSMFTYNEPTPSIPYNNPMLLGQPTLEDILRSHLAKYGCAIELGTELQSFEDDGERVFAKLIKRKDGQEISETFEASYLIGADGARGVARKQLGLTFLGETKQEFASLVGDICLEVEGIDSKHWHFIGNRSSNFLMLRPAEEIAPDGFQFLMTLKDYDPKQLIADEKLMFKCMSELMGHEINIRKVVCVSEFRPNIRMVDKFGGGRVFIVGGEITVICSSLTNKQPPQTQPILPEAKLIASSRQLNLAWKVSLVHKGISPVTLLDSYTPERLPVIAEMLNMTTGILHKMREAPTVERAMEREKRMNMLGVNYRASPIVVDEFTHAEPVNAYGVLDEGVLVAGDRAPDATALVVLANGAETETRTVRRVQPDLSYGARVHSGCGVVDRCPRGVEEVSWGRDSAGDRPSAGF
ncbi:hypothetical protein J3R83DRAFT_3958 [Lanmaoa asiatica]|nr:hypothetical protein J3R83DRAFT_3958 [Lanmaoa asiatica]